MAITFEAAKSLLGLLKVAPAVQGGLRKWRGRPTEVERTRLVAYGRRLDERRVFSAPFNSEVVELCLGSLNEVRCVTDEVLAEIEHPGARAMLGAILDVVRHFYDEWHGFHTPHHWDRWEPRHHHDGGVGMDRDMVAFFEDLGELRGKVRLLLGALVEIEPDMDAPILLGGEAGDGGKG